MSLHHSSQAGLWQSYLKDDVGSGGAPDSKFGLFCAQAQTRGREGDIEATDPLSEQEKM